MLIQGNCIYTDSGKGFDDAGFCYVWKRNAYSNSYGYRVKTPIVEVNSIFDGLSFVNGTDAEYGGYVSGNSYFDSGKDSDTLYSELSAGTDMVEILPGELSVNIKNISTESHENELLIKYTGYNSFGEFAFVTQRSGLYKLARPIPFQNWKNRAMHGEKIYNAGNSMLLGQLSALVAPACGYMQG